MKNTRFSAPYAKGKIILSAALMIALTAATAYLALNIIPQGWSVRRYSAEFATALTFVSALACAGSSAYLIGVLILSARDTTALTLARGVLSYRGLRGWTPERSPQSRQVRPRPTGSPSPLRTVDRDPSIPPCCNQRARTSPRI